MASGGELSRISLALHVTTASQGSVPCMIFDEVDVGIGGGVAEVVGQLLKQLGAERQVLVITHLPQVAAQAAQHLQVSKSQANGATLSHIQAIKSNRTCGRNRAHVGWYSDYRNHARACERDVKGLIYLVKMTCSASRMDIGLQGINDTVQALSASELFLMRVAYRCKLAGLR